MSDYETSTTVNGHGEIHLVGLPFQPGTPVEVVVSPKISDQTATDADRVATLFAALDRARNTESVSSLKRDELYDRDLLR